MIKIDKHSIIKPKILDNTWIAEKLNKIQDMPNPGDLITEKYNDKSVRTALNQLYRNKCAYCQGEAETAQYTSRIDHFRPKDKIKVNKKQIENHKGYYWLGYEWTNLLPTCEKCNNHKSNQFPLKEENSRISDNLAEEGFINEGEFQFDNFKITKLVKEQRLLLNPEIDDVDKHLYFLPTGEIRHITEEGETTIKIYDLNRGSLIFERKKIIDDIVRELISIFIKYEDNRNRMDEFFDKLNENNSDLKYSRFRFFIQNFFDFFIIQRFEDIGLSKHAQILKDIYKQRSV